MIAASPGRRFLASAAAAAVVAAGTLSWAQEAPPRADDPFVEATRRVRGSVLGVGSYAPKDTPSVIYYGTGFAIDDGLTVVTNDHVVEGIRQHDRLEQMRLFFPDGAIEGRRATVLAEDRFHDLALLRLEGPPAPVLDLDGDEPRQGQTVGMMGYPMGLQLGLVPAVHRGVVAAVVPAVLPLPKGAKLTPELAEAIRRPYQLYQLDMIAFPGNSGSPLFEGRDGRVIGIINKGLASRTREHLLTQPSGVTYAVPARWIAELLARSKAISQSTQGAKPQ